MKRAGIVTLAVLVTILLAGVDRAAALEPVAMESGFSGFIRPGVGYMRFKSNMVASFMGTDLSDEKTDSLYDDPDSESSAVVIDSDIDFYEQEAFIATGGVFLKW